MTTDNPTTPGFYWVKENPTANWEVVWVVPAVGGGLAAVDFLSSTLDLTVARQWVGPIKAPTP